MQPVRLLAFRVQLGRHVLAYLRLLLIVEQVPILFSEKPLALHVLRASLVQPPLLFLLNVQLENFQQLVPPLALPVPMETSVNPRLAQRLLALEQITKMELTLSCVRLVPSEKSVLQLRQLLLLVLQMSTETQV